MMAMTTSSSIRVKARRQRLEREGGGIGWASKNRPALADVRRRRKDDGKPEGWYLGGRVWQYSIPAGDMGRNMGRGASVFCSVTLRNDVGPHESPAPARS